MPGATRPTTLDAARTNGIVERLAAANLAMSDRYPGESGLRQPVHTVYGGAQLFGAETCRRLGERAITIMREFAPDGLVLGRAIGLSGTEHLPQDRAHLLSLFEKDPERARAEAYPAWLADLIHRRVMDKLLREPVEDFRIDFEDGYGTRPDPEEDGHAASTAREVARGMQQGLLPPFIGIRLKPFNEENRRRSMRTLDIFVTELVQASGGRLPDNFVVTLPKITCAEQPAALADLLDLLENGLDLPPHSLRLELMIETPQSIVDRRGRIPLLEWVEASRDRCVAAHFGTYDFTAYCQITASWQTMDHPLCMSALHILKMGLAGTGVWLSDGATNVLPVPVHRAAEGKPLTQAQAAENQKHVHDAWRIHFGNVTNSLRNGYYQGWDLHPAQLVTRYAAVFTFFLEGVQSAGERLRNFVEKAAQATLVGDVFDDAATGQALLNYFLRAENCGALTESEVTERTGLTLEELRTRSFVAILKHRNAASAKLVTTPHTASTDAEWRH